MHIAYTCDIKNGHYDFKVLVVLNLYVTKNKGNKGGGTEKGNYLSYLTKERDQNVLGNYSIIV